MKKTGEKAAWGTHLNVFLDFYRSGERSTRIEYGEVAEAIRAQVSMLNAVNRRHIYDVRITRRKNGLYLERTGAECPAEKDA